MIDVETGGWDFALRATHWRLQRVVLVTNAETPPEANRFSDFAHRRGVARLLRIVKWERVAAKVGTRKLRMRSGYPPAPTPEKHPQNQVLGLRVLYINLASRQDRDREFKAVISEASLPNATRVSAVLNKNGAFGCAMSHLKALELARGYDGPVMICADDLMFIGNIEDMHEALAEFLSDPYLDVLMLANNQKMPAIPYSKLLSITTNAQTTACYVVKPSAIPAIRAIFSDATGRMIAENGGRALPIDKAWKSLQGTALMFAVPTTTLALQRPGWSDIEHRHVDYGV